MHFKFKSVATAVLIVHFYVLRLIDCLSVVDENQAHGEKHDEQHRSKRFIFLRTAGMGVSTEYAMIDAED